MQSVGLSCGKDVLPGQELDFNTVLLTHAPCTDLVRAQPETSTLIFVQEMAAMKIKKIRIWLVFSKACKHRFGYVALGMGSSFNLPPALSWSRNTPGKMILCGLKPSPWISAVICLLVLDSQQAEWMCSLPEKMYISEFVYSSPMALLYEILL